ncbi:alpha/beta hydrolase [Chitinophagaceae bacterium LWZ2-11]
MKLSQRIAVNYYKTKFKTLALISTRKAAEAAFKLFCTPYSGKPKREQPLVFRKAEELQLDIAGLKISGWSWVPEKPNGKKILIVHGFDSCSYKFEKYVPLFLKEGFEVLAFDAPGHGASEGKYIYIPLYRDMLLKINEHYGPIYGIMAHSLGGMAAGLMVEDLQNIPKLILIAPAVELERGLNNFANFVGLSDEIKRELSQVIVDAGQLPISFYSLSRAVQKISSSILWLHDERDSICPFDDVLPVINMNLPHIQFYITKGLGHSNIYKNSKSIQKVVSFLAES